jgi:hypothetical protein
MTSVHPCWSLLWFGESLDCLVGQEGHSGVLPGGLRILVKRPGLEAFHPGGDGALGLQFKVVELVCSCCVSVCLSFDRFNCFRS